MNAVRGLEVLSPEGLARLDGKAPRYTSFPTAAQFNAAVGESETDEWLTALSGGGPVSLYVHLPFCKRLCWYCGCNTRAVNRREAISSYVALIDREAERITGLTGRLSVSRLHLGGGTPNMLSPDDLDALFGALRQRFDLEGAHEIAAELDPAVLDPAWIEAAARHGLTRASLGVQDLSERVQRAVNRIEPFEVIARAAEGLRRQGVRSLNLDLMYGLPEQTAADVEATVDSILTLRPDRIALFGYAHVPWMKPHQKLIDETRLPGTMARLEQSVAAAARLEAAGYVAVGIDHFALPQDSLGRAAIEGRLRRNFQGYTDDTAETLIGLGASSISRTKEGFWQNQAQETAWRTAVISGRSTTARGVRLSPQDRLRGAVIERLMCDFAVDLAEICAGRGFGLDVLSQDLARLDGVVADGLARVEGGVVSATAAGRRFVRLIAAAFDPYLEAGALRHARVS